MALLDINCIRQTTMSRAMLWWRNQSPVHHFSGYFHHTSSHRHHQMSARNGCSVCSYGTNSWHMTPCTSKLTSVSISHRNKLLCLLQAGRSHVVICNDLWKEVWMSGISSECPSTQWCNSNCLCSSISIQGKMADSVVPWHPRALHKELRNQQSIVISAALNVRN
jgi:hypothetical protein